MALADVSDVDGWISVLMNCKQLPESDVKKLCEKVCIAEDVMFYVEVIPCRTLE